MAVKLGIHTSPQGFTDPTKDVAAALRSEVFVWLPGNNPISDTVGYENKIHIVRLPTPPAQPQQAPNNWLGNPTDQNSVAALVQRWIGWVRGRPAQLYFIIGNEPEESTGGPGSDVPVAWNIYAWVGAASGYVSALRSTFPGVKILSTPFLVNHTSNLTASAYYPLFDGYAVHSYWVKGDTDGRAEGFRGGDNREPSRGQGITSPTGGGSWQFALPYVTPGKPLFITECNLNRGVNSDTYSPTDADEAVKWLKSLNNQVTGVSFYAPDLDPGDPNAMPPRPRDTYYFEYTIGAIEAGEIRAKYDAWVNAPQTQQAPRYGVFNADAPAAKQRAKDAGATHVMVQVRWDRAQPGGPGTALDTAYFGGKQAEIADARARGLQVLLEAGLHYLPAWAASAIPPFRNQAGATWAEDTEGGRNIRDWFWTQTGRAHVADFLFRVYTGVNLAQVDAARVGGGYYNELHGPPSIHAHDPIPAFDWWGFGDAAQGGPDLAADMVPCPYPGYIPYAGTTLDDKLKTVAWLDWWCEGHKQFMLWQISVARAAGFSGDLYVNHPGFMLRDDMADTSTGYKDAVAEGQDVERMIAAYADLPNVWPHCTWIDGVHPYPADPSFDSDLAAWYKVAAVARRHNKHMRLSGENSGLAASNLDMSRAFALDAGADGYNFLWWLQHSTLAGSEPGVVGAATYAHLAANIAYHNDPSTAPPPVSSPLTVIDNHIAVYLTGTGIVQSGGVVTQWRDGSGNGRHSDIAMGGACPTYFAAGGPRNLPFVRFDGVANLLMWPAAAFAHGGAYTLFVIGRVRVASGGAAAFCSKSAYPDRRMELGVASNGQPYYRSGTDGNYDEFFTAGRNFLNRWGLFGWTVRNGADFDEVLDGSPQTRAGQYAKYFTVASTGAPFALGAGLAADAAEYAAVDIAEVIFCDAGVEQQVRQRIETYCRLRTNLF